MKKLFIIFALAFSHFFNVYGQRDKFDQLFDKYQEVEGVTSIKIAKPMFGMLSSLNIDDSQLDQIKPLLSKINGLKILITENPEKSNTSDGRRVQNNLSQLSRDISSYLKNLNYSEIMSVNNSGAKIKFLSAEAKNGILDDLLLSIDGGGGESIFVMLDGKLSMDDVSKIISSSETKKNPISNTRNTLTSESNPSYLNGEARNVGDFSGIQVSTGVNVVFKQEKPTSVKVIADSDKLQYIITKVENGVLKIYIDNKGVRNLRFKNMSVNVSSPRMSSIDVSSGSNFTVVNSIQENNMRIDASSGANVTGDFKISGATDISASSGSNVRAGITTGNIAVKSSSGSNTSLNGSAESGTIDISSGAVCKADDLKLTYLETEATSGGNLSVNVSGKLKVRASSGGLVKYKGRPEIESNISKTSGGSLRPMD
ncbi:hypothetical protein C1637_10770 [Chryseobacterium lactis]|uniref:DUF4252 domain-containing protein n=1 Tax=Chryseobacterium lactis TaxID=1241981 RepID=A0A3G6RVT0_CHRLC|nr:DUF4252 domain-containing protein [Chryseobacterium lactis]AZA80975.1 DUF4252 domain-containing protein [Chryseobacterium lactis]AZB05976.1 DUF4252 domain-containing protein [Chryseobacterium lactis]PNW13304.1 hypothetical protein C1637_10770 [Chryseobacterium lactis]